jgi:hypothetical protein
MCTSKNGMVKLTQSVVTKGPVGGGKDHAPWKSRAKGFGVISLRSGAVATTAARAFNIRKCQRKGFET